MDFTLITNIVIVALVLFVCFLIFDKKNKLLWKRCFKKLCNCLRFIMRGGYETPPETYFPWPEPSPTSSLATSTNKFPVNIEAQHVTSVAKRETSNDLSAPATSTNLTTKCTADKKTEPSPTSSLATSTNKFPIDIEAQHVTSLAKRETSNDLSAPAASTDLTTKCTADKKTDNSIKNKKVGTEKKSTFSSKNSKDLGGVKEKAVYDSLERANFNAIKKSLETTQVQSSTYSKGKFGPNTKPKGGAKQSSESQKTKTNNSKPDVEPSHRHAGDLTTQSLPQTESGRPTPAPVEPQTSATNTSVITTKAEIHVLCQAPKHSTRAKKSVLESPDPIENLYNDEVDLPLHFSELGTNRPHYKGISDVINPRIRFDISNSVPVCSQKVIQKPSKREGRPSVHWSHSVELKSQKTVLDEFSETPPSPAPPTPENLKHLLYKEHSYSGGRSEVPIERRTEWSYKEKNKLLLNNHNQACFGTEFYTIESKRLDEYLDLEYIDPEHLDPELNSPDHIYPEKTYPEPTYPAMMNPLEDDERKIIIEFCHLLEKSKQLFNGLRELPQYGHKQWSLYFGRTFDIYTKIWKFQQTHRSVLDSKYGMKRWQIGEIASKIGQLYYHFYLRTSETAYLNEAFSFYAAIRGRCYYTKANKEDKCELMVKKLRYYARFIVVCLLLNKMKLVKELIKELERQIIEYGNTYDPDDQVEWTVVVDEIKAFIHAEPVVSVVNTDNQTMILSHRLSSLMIPPVERSSQMNLSLQEILIVGSSSQQVKFSELTMDMFRMLQTLEREPSGDIQHIFDESPRQRFMSTPIAQSHEGVETGQKMPNPHKYLLFKPSPSQMLVYLSSAINDLPPSGALLLYISADGFVSQNGKYADDGTWGYDLGGLITTSKNDIYRECSKDPKSSISSKYKELQCIYPGDLYPYTRRPLFLIVDSDNSYAFQNMPRHFSQPLVILMSPLDLPPSYHDPRRQGSLFTLFLHSPLEGICYCCDLSSVSLAVWDRAQMLLDTFMAEASSILVRSRIDPAYISFMGDDFLRVLLARFVFCEAVLRLHRLFRGRTHHTRCSPVLPDELFEHPTLVHIILDIANILQIRNHIQDPSVANAVATAAPPN